MTDNYINIWMPFSKYSLNFRHKLLSQLGEISHLIILSMSEYHLSINDVSLITKLDERQLEPIVSRLVGLDILSKDMQLTKKGFLLAYVLQNIHDKNFSDCAMDSHYRDRDLKEELILIKNYDENLAIIPIDACNILPPHHRSSTILVEDCYYQTSRLQRNLDPIMQYLFGEEFATYKIMFKDLLGAQNTDFMFSSFVTEEWAVTVKKDSAVEQKGLLIPVLKDYLIKGKGSHKELVVASQCLSLLTTFSYPKGVLDFLKGDQPEEKVYYYSEATRKCIRHNNQDFLEMSISEKYLKVNEFIVCENTSIVDNLLCCLEESLDNQDKFYSREYSYNICWELYHFDYHSILKCLSRHKINLL